MSLYQEYAIGTTSGERDLYDTSGTPYFKRNIYDLSGKYNNVESHIPIYESIQRYNFINNVYVPEDLKFLAFDIDSSSTLEAVIDAKKFVTWLELYNIHDYKLYWSGSKGIHIIISWVNLGKIYDEFTPRILSTMVNKYIAPLSGVTTFDVSIYNNRSLFRVPNTRNIKTGLYKIPILRDELFSDDLGQIEIMSKTTRSISTTNDVPSDYSSLSRLYDLSADINQINNDRPTNVNTYGDIAPIDFIEDYISSATLTGGMRHQVSLVLAAYFKARGMNQDEALEALSNFMTSATGSSTPVRQRLSEVKNDIRTCYNSTARFSYYKAKEILK